MDRKINHYAEVPARDSNSSQYRLAKCTRSMIKSRGEESKRAKRVIKSISSDYPKVFHSFLQEQGHVPKGDRKIDAESVLTMTLESNLKRSQLRIID